VHGEADLIEALLGESGGTRVLDAGCGTGRVAIELALRGFSVVGIDADPAMLSAAKTKAPQVRWIEADLVETDAHLQETFDIVAMPGNVMIFLDRGTEATVVSQLARRLAPGGLLVAGFQLVAGRLTLARYDEVAAAAGLELADRWATWDRDPYEGGDYAVSVHQLT
jgi:SAM-dependent methyltransferase